MASGTALACILIPCARSVPAGIETAGFQSILEISRLTGRDLPMRRTAFAEGWLLLILFMVLTSGICRAQDLDKLDDLESLDEDVVTEKPFEAGIDTDKWELSFQIGFMNLAQTLFRADQIVVKWNSKGKIFGDMEVQGKSSFSPQLRLSRNWGHLGWQQTIGLTHRV